jgi:hypothetical protein
LDLPDALKIPGLTVTGDVRTGLRVDGATADKFGEEVEGSGGFIPFNPYGSRSAGAQDPVVYAHSDDLDDGTPFRAQLQLVWERENLGVKTRFRYRPDGSTNIAGQGNLNGNLTQLNNTVNKAFVYGKLLDDKVRVTAGKTLDEAWSLFYSNFNTTGGFDGKDGVKIEVKPIPGLNLGAFYGTGDLFNNASKNSTRNDWVADRRLAVGAKYTSKLFSVVAATMHNFVEPDLGVNAYRSDSAGTMSLYTDLEGNIDNPIPNTSNLLVGLRVNPIEPLQIDLSFMAVNLGSKTVKTAYNDGEEITGLYKKGDFNPFWRAWLKFKAAYAVNDKLGVALDIYDISFADSVYYDVADADTAEDKGLGHLFPITISPSATYAITDDITAGVALGFKINSGGSDQFGFGFKPSAEFSLGSGATFVVWDELTFWGKSNDDVDFFGKHPSIQYDHQGGNGGASGTTNSLQFDFVWTF